MNALHTLTSQVPSTRRPLLRGAIASAVLALAGTATTGALAQVPQHTPAPSAAQTQVAAMPHSIHDRTNAVGRTRAEVIAELQCARESGELEASVLAQYGLVPPARQGARANCAQDAQSRQMAQGQ